MWLGMHNALREDLSHFIAITSDALTLPVTPAPKDLISLSKGRTVICKHSTHTYTHTGIYTKNTCTNTI